MINRDEWLAAVRELEPAHDPEALTVSELQSLLGTKKSTTKSRLAKLIEDGTAIQTSKRITDNLGRSQFVTAYRLLKRKGK